MVNVLRSRSPTPRRGASFVFSVPHFGQQPLRMVGDDSSVVSLWESIIKITTANGNPLLREASHSPSIGNEFEQAPSLGQYI
jgi:hypothetical protein